MSQNVIHKYEKLCKKSVQLNTNSEDYESAHIHQDKVYRTFINDICKGNLKSLKQINQPLL